MTRNLVRNARSAWMTALVAGVAIGLAVGVAGPATAGGLTKSKVRQLVSKVVAQQAPTLSVAHAKSADTADSAIRAQAAATADSAMRADVATDAEKLAGAEPGAYLEQAAYRTVGDHATFGASPVPAVRPVTFTVPPGIEAVRVTGAASVYASGATSVYLYVASNASCSGGPGGTLTPKSTVGVEQAWGHVTVDRIVPVIPGTHDFTLCAQAQNNTWQVNLSNPSFIVETVALNR